ncbi:MAG: 50S ribosomal protein L9 [Candidatus Paceibacterota bacterium]
MATTKVILLESVPKLGARFETKAVASGYARNFLLPQKKAVLATEANLAGLNDRQARVKQDLAVQAELFKKEIERFRDIVVTISMPANEEGGLYQAVHENDIVEALSREHKLVIDPSWLKLPTVVKKVGDYDILIAPAGSSDRVIRAGEEAPAETAQIKLTVVAK